MLPLSKADADRRIHREDAQCGAELVSRRCGATPLCGGAAAAAATQEIDAEQPARVAPHAFARIYRARDQGTEFGIGILVGILRTNTCALLEGKEVAVDHDGLRATADEMHLDPPFLLIVIGLLAKPGDIHLLIELAPYAHQQIEVEGCGYTARIIVGAMQHGPILFQIDTN